VTLYEAVKTKPVDELLERYIAYMKRFGKISFKVGDNDRVFSTEFSPLIYCDNSGEVELIHKMLKMAGAHALVRDRAARQTITHKRANQIKQELKLRRIACNMEHQSHTFTGGTKVIRVWAVKYMSGENTRSFITVLLERGERQFGYYFPLKAGLMLTGLL
jgi:hypothetical protein